MDKQQDNKCYLHVERVDDKFIVVDDLGRQVAMTRAVSVGAEYKVSRLNPELVRIYLVAAMGANRVIGNGPDIPWKIPGEQKIFRRLTEGKVVVMGRKTFESIGKPLPNRRTVVLSRQASYSAAGCAVVSTLSQAIAIAAEHGKELYVAGGAEVYALALPRADGVFLSEVHQTFEGDAFFPVLDEAEFEVVSAETVQATITYTHSVYARRNG